MHAHACTHTCTCAHAHSLSHTHTHACAHTYAHIYIYIYIYIYRMGTLFLLFCVCNSYSNAKGSHKGYSSTYSNLSVQWKRSTTDTDWLRHVQLFGLFPWPDTHLGSLLYTLSFIYAENKYSFSPSPSAFLPSVFKLTAQNIRKHTHTWR